MPLSMLRTRPRLQTNAMQGTAGQGQGSGAQKAVALRRMRRRRACSRRHLASGAPDVYGDVTRAARGSDGKLRAFFLDACQSPRRPWHLLEPRHHVLPGIFFRGEAGPVFRLSSGLGTEIVMLRGFSAGLLPSSAAGSPPPAQVRKPQVIFHQTHNGTFSILRTTIAAAYDCIDSTLFAPVEV